MLRRSRRCVRIAGAGLALALGASAARGQAPPPSPAIGPWQITAIGGWYSGATPYVLDGTSQKVELESAAEYGLRLGYDFTPHFGLEMAWTQSKPDVTLSGDPEGGLGHRNLNTYELDGLYYATRGCIRLFGALGVGGASTGSSFGGTNLTASGGLGVKIFFDRRWALRLQGLARTTYGNLGPGDTIAYCDRFGCYNYRTSWYWTGEAFGGVTFAF